MQGAELGASFGVSTDYIESRHQFSSDISILVYVEGFEDIPFWKKVFKDKDIPVEVIAYGQNNKANGKGTVTNAIRNKHLSLGRCLIVALDSDYDYLLDNNVDIFELDTVFQTYAYSIENLRWNPEQLDYLCQVASNNTTYLPDNQLKNGIENWSQAVYPKFLDYLKGKCINDELFLSIIDSLQLDDGKIVYNDNQAAPFTDLDFTGKMKQKGLIPENVYLFIRGHDYADKIESHCQSINSLVFEKLKQDLKDKHGDNSGQFIGELKNHQSEPAVILKGFGVSCNLCVPKINADIDTFVSNYH